MDAGSSSSPGSASTSTSTANSAALVPLTPRQREKAVAAVNPEAVVLPPTADHEITLLIADYLSTKHPRLADVLAAEIGPARDESIRLQIDGVERAILDGDFGALEGLLAPSGLLGPQTQKAFLYMCYRQQFLEYIDNRESQKAFNLLQKRLKPLEHYQPVPYDFYSLAYLTSASTVHDAPGLRDWAGAGPERERLLTMWRELTDGARQATNDGSSNRDTASFADGALNGGQETPGAVIVPKDRLLTLLRQAAAWQIGASRPRNDGPWAVPSLLADYSRPAVPSVLERLIKGHRANVKCVDFIGDSLGISGSSDATLRIFDIQDGTTRRVLAGHQSRLWDVSVSQSQSLIASGSGDGTVRIWRPDGECTSVLAGDGGDIYGVRWQSGREDHVVAACYDKILRMWDVEQGKLVRTFSGHAQSTLSVAFDPTGKVIASGSKDKHIRLWDAVGGVCVQTMTAHLGEVTSVEFDHEGKYLLAGCKDNSNRLWDLRMQRNIYRYTGHQNTSKNIIRCAFASPTSSLIASGSEDGLVYLWDREGSSGEESMRTSAASTPAPGSPALGSSSGTVSRTHALAALAPTATALRGPSPYATLGAQRSPAYYPPRNRVHIPPPSASATTTVRPLKALAGHGRGAVFDVRAHVGTLLSAGEDCAVGVWGDEDGEI